MTARPEPQTTDSDVTTALRAAYEREQEAARQLRELDRLRTEFIATASHELRTPLTVVLGFARMLDGRWDTLDDATRIHLVKRIAASGQRLEQLIADMIDFTRAENGRVDVHTEEQQLDELAHSAAYAMRALVDGHELVVDVMPGIVVLADRTATRRILENLIAHAMQHAAARTRIVIDVGPRTNADEVTLRVLDEGPRIDEAQLEHIFEPFGRSAVDAERAAPSTGIGLSIARVFAEAQGGRMWAEAGPGTGNAYCCKLRRVTAPGSDT